jgi:secreted PhoX family phosphatase
MNSKISRRSILRSTAGAAGFVGLRTALEHRLSAQPNLGFGPLVPDPEGLLDLPRGFKYRAFSRTGDPMDDGYRVPGAHDGMAAFPGPNGNTLLVRNHEMQVVAPGASGSPYSSAASYAAVNKNLVYDNGSTSPASGGTTNLIFDTRTLRLENHFLSHTGTIRNCAGGQTPWGTWLTCEETGLRAGQAQGGSTLSKDHGWVFEVSATQAAGIQPPLPLTSLGRFSHEALAIDPNTGIVYLTEDQGNSVFYRFVPTTLRNLQSSSLQSGRLQALKFKAGNITDTRNSNGPVFPSRVPFDVEWVDLSDIAAPNDDLRTRASALGAALFAREEGAWWGNNAIYFACTSGGPAGLGQIFKYTPSPMEGTAGEASSPGRIELFIEPTSESQFAAPDNICVAPFGDIIVCEDGGGIEYVHGVTSNSSVYKIAANALNDSEFAGACFSPDGRVLFVNIQSPGITLAITGPWQRRVA